MHRATEQRQVRYCVRLRKVFYPKKFSVSQFHRLSQHLEKPEKDWDLNHHRQTAANRIDAVLLVELHQLLVHPRRIVLVLLPQLLHFGIERSHLAHRSVCSVLNRPERELDNCGQSENGETVIMQPAVEEVHEVEQKLADDLEHSEVHHLGFIVRKLRETMVGFRARLNFKTRAVCLPGLQLKPRHAKRSLDGGQFLIGRVIDIETPTPHASGFGCKRGHKRGKKLIAHSNPFRAANALLIIRSRRALAETKKSAAATKPTNINSFCPSVDTPAEPGVGRIVLGMNRRR